MGTCLPALSFDGYPEPNISEKIGLVFAHTVTSVKEGVTVACVLNATGNAVELKQGLHVGELYPLSDFSHNHHLLCLSH
uniref:Uncharacterized protein n=1 Tax=Oryzias melastigma TaxID=30732 RepID=A0A3B3D2I3_ORYME